MTGLHPRTHGGIGGRAPPELLLLRLHRGMSIGEGVRAGSRRGGGGGVGVGGMLVEGGNAEIVGAKSGRGRRRSVGVQTGRFVGDVGAGSGALLGCELHHRTRGGRACSQNEPTARRPESLLLPCGSTSSSRSCHAPRALNFARFSVVISPTQRLFLRRRLLLLCFSAIAEFVTNTRSAGGGCALDQWFCRSLKGSRRLVSTAV